MAWKPAEDPLTRLARTMVVSAQHVGFSSLASVLKAQQEIGQQMTEPLRLDATSTLSLSAKPLAGGGDADTDIEVLNTDSVQALAEQGFETRLRPLLQRGGVASRAEIERLTREVEVLTRRVEALCHERKREGSNG